MDDQEVDDEKEADSEEEPDDAEEEAEDESEDEDSDNEGDVSDSGDENEDAGDKETDNRVTEPSKPQVKEVLHSQTKEASKSRLKKVSKAASKSVVTTSNSVLKEASVTTESTSQSNEYDDHDTSDEEDIRNTVGNIPMQWYDEYRHLGYDWDGNKILKPATGDQLDNFLQRLDDPDFWRTVKDIQTGQDVVLSDKDVALIRRIQAQKIPDETFDEYAVSFIAFFLIFTS